MDSTQIFSFDTMVRLHELFNDDQLRIILLGLSIFRYGDQTILKCAVQTDEDLGFLQTLLNTLSTMRVMSI